ncbi:MAG: ABC transporter ATP-binding protein [Opitutae bacterium]|nr:ABC transporter ATP-binding protein [Opitutae bacterium]|tara:strand:- start:933 stop:1631 length:699 start_codon:yes stop_codon:yes gene_type:complete
MNSKVNGATPVLRVENLSHSFGEGQARVEALRGVSFEARAGEVTAIVGPSGCGKSTMLYLLGLLDQPDSGEIYLRGKPMTQADDSTRTALRNKSIGFVFQFHFLIKEFTARENVAMPLRKAGVLSDEALFQAEKFLKQLGLSDKAKRFANKLSGGEQQRVAIARALVNSPDLILADEPTGNLDAANSDRVFDVLLKFARDNGPAVILVTHNPELAKRCDRRLPMLDGKFVEE